MSINSRIEILIEKFKEIENWEDKYKLIIGMGKELSPMKEEYKTDDNKLNGCQSQVWLFAELNGDKITFTADSDASIVKGIIAMLLSVYSDSTPDEILSTRPDFLEKIGIREHLSMSRASGLASMLKQISVYAIAFKAKIAMSK